MSRIHQLLAPLTLVLAAGFAAADNPKADRPDAPNQAADQQNTIKGRVQSVAADQNQVVVRDENNRDWAFQINPDARVRVNDKDARAADLKEGDQVNVSFRQVARHVLAAQGDQAGQFAAGRVQSVSNDGAQLVLKGHDGQERTFQVAQDARVRIDGKEGKLADLKQGDHAVVIVSKQGDQQAAREVISEREGRGVSLAAGQVERVSADRNQVVLKDQAGREHAFQLGQDAQVRIDGKDAKASDLQPGNQVAVAYQRVASEINSQRGDK